MAELRSLPIAQIVWARYVAAALIALVASRPLSRPSTLRSKRPRLQLFRSALLLGSTMANVLAVRQLQLSETATISFLTPIFVALLGGTCARRTRGRGTHDRDRARISRRRDRDSPGSGGLPADRARRGRRGRLQLRLCAGDPQARRRSDCAQTTLAWTQIAGIVFLTPLLPWIWRHPATPRYGLSWRQWALSGPPATRC